MAILVILVITGFIGLKIGKSLDAIMIIMKMLSLTINTKTTKLGMRKPMLKLYKRIKIILKKEQKYNDSKKHYSDL